MSITQFWPLHVDSQLVLQGIMYWYIGILWIAYLSLLLIKFVSPSIYSTINGIKQKNEKLLGILMFVMLIIGIFWIANVGLNGSVIFNNVEIPPADESSTNPLIHGALFLVAIIPCVLILGSKRVSGKKKLLWFLAILIASWPGYLYFYIKTSKTTAE